MVTNKMKKNSFYNVKTKVVILKCYLEEDVNNNNQNNFGNLINTNPI